MAPTLACIRTLPILVLACLSTALAGGTHPATSSEGELASEVLRFDLPRRVERPLRDTTLALSLSGFLSTDQDPEGDLPRDVAFLADGSAVVIANRDTDVASFFDVTSRTITHSVAVGDFPVDVAVTPDNRYALLPCVFSDALAVVDIATHTQIALVPITGTQPFRVEATRDGRFAVVGVINDAISSAFSIIDLTTLSEVRSIPSTPQGVIGGFFTPEAGISGNLYTQFAVAGDSKTLVLPDRGGNQVTLYDLTTGLTLASIATAAVGPEAVDISLDGTTAVVSHEFAAQAISVIDLATATLTATIPTGLALNNQVIRITPDKSHAIAAIQNGVIFVDLTSGVVDANINTGTVGDIELTADGKYAFVSNFNARVIDIATRTLVKTITFAACNDAAVSPTQNRAVALNNRFREDIQLYDVNGAAGLFEGRALTGEPQEGDATRTLALSPDGRTLIAANNTSRTAAIIDLDARAISGYVPTGERSLGVAFSPDGRTAVVCNADDDTVNIIDVALGQTVKTLSVASRPGEVLISPDGQWAYVTTIAGTDRVHFIKLDGANSAVVKSLVTGQMGSIIYTYNVLSGMAQSADGKLLVLCISFDDQLMVVDTTTQTEIARLGTGDFPIRAAFAGNGALCFVSNAFSDDVSVFNIDLLAQIPITKVTGVDFPLTVNGDATGSFVYVGGFGTPTEIGVIATAGLTKVKSVVLPAAPRAVHYSPLSERLYAALTDGQLARIGAAGAGSALIDLRPLTGSPADLVFSEFSRTAIAAQPGLQDGVDLVDYSDECPGSITGHGSGCPGSGGFVPQLTLTGCPVAGGSLQLTVDQGLGGSTALLLFGLVPAAIPVGGGCTLNLSPVLPGVFALPLSGSGPGGGSISLTGPIPPGTGAFSLEMQVFTLDPGVVGAFANTAGITLSLP